MIISIWKLNFICCYTFFRDWTLNLNWKVNEYLFNTITDGATLQTRSSPWNIFPSNKTSFFPIERIKLVDL